MKISLKMRVFIVFFGVLFLLAGSYLFTVTRFITRFTTKQLNDDYNSLLLEVSETMQNLLWNLTLTSGQLLDNDRDSGYGPRLSVLFLTLHSSGILLFLIKRYHDADHGKQRRFPALSLRQ